MKKVLSVAEFVSAVVIAVFGSFLCRDFLSLYQTSDARELSQTLTVCSEATMKIGTTYKQVHESLLPSVAQAVSSTHNFIQQMEEPTKMITDITYTNFPSGLDFGGSMNPKNWKLKHTYPFEKWQQPMKTFRDETRPKIEKSLFTTQQVITDFQNGASHDVVEGIPRISQSIKAASACVAKQEQLNKKIAYTILAISLTASLLLFVSGSYHWKKQA